MAYRPPVPFARPLRRLAGGGYAVHFSAFPGARSSAYLPSPCKQTTYHLYIDKQYPYAIIASELGTPLPCPANMARRQVVLLTPPEAVHLTPLPFYKQTAPITPLDSALIELFILKTLKSFRMNTYKKHGGRGVLLLTRRSGLAEKEANISSLPRFSAHLPQPFRGPFQAPFPHPTAPLSPLLLNS